MAPSPSLRRVLVASTLAGGALVTGCGARGPLDTIVVEYVGLDASLDGPIEGATPEAGLDGGSDGSDAARDAPPDVVDAAPETSMVEAGPIVCATCIGQSCGTQLLQCALSTDCRTALQCTVTTCLTGGTPNLTCVLGCTMGNTMTEEQLVEILECVVMSCGTDCAGALGGLGGL